MIAAGLRIGLLALLLFAATARGEDAAVEIDYLASAVGSSGCTFIRNGKRHDAADAEAHLRMKYRRGKRYAPTAELFIERLASRSSISNKPYYIECTGQEPVETGTWLTRRLEDFRSHEDG